MDKIEKYQGIIIEFLEAYAKIKPANQPDVENYVIADREHNHFQLLRIGWQGPQYVFSVVFQIEIKNGKVWFQRNTTELEVVDVLMEKGILREDIVLGFRPPYARPHTGFATI